MGPQRATPLVSVVVPAWNAERTIAETLESVLRQTLSDFELIVVDDGSTDATLTIVADFAARDSRVRLVTQPNAGVAAARNRGIREARGRYVAPLDADDLWHSENLARQVARLEASNPPAPFSFAASRLIDESGEPVATRAARRRPPRGDFASLVLRNEVGNGSAAVFRRDALLAVGGYDASLRARGAQGAEDWQLVLSLAARAPGIALPEVLVDYRQARGSMSSNPEPMARSIALVIATARRLGPRLPPWHYWHARTTMQIWLFYRWIAARRYGRALGALAQAYLLNPLWFSQHYARDFLRRDLLPHLLRRLCIVRRDRPRTEATSQ